MSGSVDQNTRGKYSVVLVVLIGCLFVFGSLYLNLQLPAWLSIGGVGNPTELGGVFGLSSALFTGLAFIGLLYANWMQRQEMQIAREELERTKGILYEQQKQLEVQNSAALKKSFEDTFFQMIQVQRVMLQHIRNGPVPGIESVDIVCGHIAYALEDPDIDHMLERVKQSYTQVRSRSEHYAEWTLRTIDLIEQGAVTDRKLYKNILISQMSSSERNLMLLSSVGFDRSDASTIKDYFLDLVVKSNQLIHPGIPRIFTG